MELRQIYGDIAAQIVQKNRPDSTQPYLYIQEFERVAVTLFAEIVQVERSLVKYDEKEIQSNLASMTATILEALEYWTKSDWCLRSPKFERRKFASGADLTSTIRSELADMVYYHERDGYFISKDVIITAEILLKRCIELSKTLDFDLAMALFEHLRK